MLIHPHLLIFLDAKMAMKVTITSSTTLTNTTSDPFELPLTIFDRFATNIHIAVIYAFSAPTSSNAAIISGLSKTLLHYPTLTGRLSVNTRGSPCVLAGDSGLGALVVEATVASRLEDHLPLEPSPEFRLLHPPDENATHLLQVQLNRFQCGGLIIGVTAHHRVADGQSMSSFFVTWGKMVRGVAVDQLPVYDLSWLIPRHPPRIEFNHWGSDFMPLRHRPNGFAFHLDDADTSDITNMLLHYSPEFIATKLKAPMPKKYTTFETLLGHLWRKITIARRLADEEWTLLRVSVNGRPRLRPPVPKEFFGNLVLNAYPKLLAKDLIEGGVAEAARVVHEAVNEIGEDYFRSFIDFGAVYGDEELVPCYDEDGVVLSPKMEVDSWLGFRFQEVDFGGGGSLCAFLPTWVPFEGLMMFVPAVNKEDGGVDVFVTLLEEHAKVLKEISHSLD